MSNSPIMSASISPPRLTRAQRSSAIPRGPAANLLIRASDSEIGSADAHARIDVEHRSVSGSVTSGNFCGYIDKIDRRSYYTVYFVAEFDQPFTATGAWHDATVTPGAISADGGTGFGAKGFPEKGNGSGVWVSFAAGRAHEVHVRVGISYVSEANARANLAAENTADTSFDTLRARVEDAWRKRLNQIEIKGGTSDERTVFTTALYHALMTPNTYSDVNGEYRGMDGQAHHIVAGQHAQYANFSGWDVYRSQLQLVTWLDPQVGSDIAQSLLNQADQNGGATHVMNGDPAAAAVADVWAFGGHSFDAKRALVSLVHAADVATADDLKQDGCPVECGGERPGLDQWLKLHYIPVGAPAWGPAADTLEDVSAEFGISSLADRLGDEATSRRFLERAQYWHNIWNPEASPEGGYFQRLVGALIRQTRRHLVVTQEELALTSGPELRFVIDLEKGKDTCEIGKALTVLQTLGIKLMLIPPSDSKYVTDGTIRL